MLAHSIKRINKSRIYRFHERHNAVVTRLENIYSQRCDASSSFHSLPSRNRVSSGVLPPLTSSPYSGKNPFKIQSIIEKTPLSTFSSLANNNDTLFRTGIKQNMNKVNLDFIPDLCTNPSFHATIQNVTLRALKMPSQRNSRMFSSFIHSNHPFLATYNYDDVDDKNFRNGQPMHRLFLQHRTFSNTPQRPETTSDPNIKPKDSSGFSTKATSVTEANISRSNDPTKKAQAIIKSASQAIADFIMATPGVLWFYLTHPAEFRQKMIDFKEAAKKEAHHYWMGTKLLAADVRTARSLLSRTLAGSTLTRRERKQLLRTTADLFRLVPMSMFVLIPFMEFALPFALKIFPNMLPSTFQDSLKAEENMKGELKARIAMAGFFQETLQSLAKEQKKRASKKEKKDSEDGAVTEEEETAQNFLAFLEKSRNGEAMPPEVIIKYAKYFEDDLTLDNMSRMQLINMCRYMGIPPYGADSLLRFQLRHKIKTLKEDDQRILWEGIDTLTKMELREACQERGMRSIGLSKSAYKLALQQWLDLSVVKHLPISLLIMSRTFFLREEMEKMTSGTSFTDDSKAVNSIADAISGLEKEVVNEVVLDVVANSLEDQKNPDVVKIKLEVLEQQNELIQEELQEREAKKKKKEEEDATIVAAESAEKGEAKAAEKEKVKDTSVVEKEKAAKSEAEGKDEAKTENLDKIKKEKVEDYDTDEEDEKGLSAAEIEAISHLLSPNAVLSEREELERIKAAITSDEQDADEEENVEEQFAEVEESKTPEPQPSSVGSTPIDAATIPPVSAVSEEPTVTVDTDLKAAKTIADMDKAVAQEAEASTTIDTDPLASKELTEEAAPEEVEEKKIETKLDKSIARLQSKVDDMVGKIELQLSDVEAKIGNKMHLLDKDNDGILTNEEVAEVLQQVLKRELTFDEAMAIAADMDGNEDGVMTIAEMLKWIETNKLVRLAEEGRDADLDAAIAKKARKVKEETQKVAEE